MDAFSGKEMKVIRVIYYCEGTYRKRSFFSFGSEGKEVWYFRATSE